MKSQKINFPKITMGVGSKSRLFSFRAQRLNHYAMRIIKTGIITIIIMALVYMYGTL